MEKTHYYIRFTDNIHRDIERGYSVHATDCDLNDFARVEDCPFLDEYDEPLIYDEYLKRWVFQQEGLDAFRLSDDCDEDPTSDAEAVEWAKKFKYNDVYNVTSMPDFAVVVGVYIDDCPEGDQIEINRVVYESYKK